MKYLHLFHNDKFTEPYIDFVNKNFNNYEHLFLILGGVSEDKIKITIRENVLKISKNRQSLFLLLKEMYKCEKIFLHGLFIRQLVVILFMQPWLIKKSNWVIWGGDLYLYKIKQKGVKSYMYENIRKFVIKRIGGLITHIKGDYELAKMWYRASGKYYYSFMYPSNMFKDYDLSKVNKDQRKTYILVGNSADPSNNHLEIFNKLEAYKNENIEIICPLSYGDSQYRENVIKEGIKIFGEKNFNFIIDFMPFEEYLKILAKTDIAIFNHKRQQAMGNITTLLGLGKKIYIRDDITTWEFCISHGLKVYCSNNNLNRMFEEMPSDEKARNIENIKKYFSEKKLADDWRFIFSQGRRI